MPDAKLPARLGWMNTSDRRGERILVHSGQQVAMRFARRFEADVLGAAALSLIRPHLQFDHPPIGSATSKQLAMGSRFDDRPGVEHDDTVRVRDGA